MQRDNTIPLVVIAGETASGKTDLAIELAKQLKGEIICSDSWTVYRGFDIGTAKPSRAERQAIPHHLIDVADAPNGFSAVEFQRLANQVMCDIASRGRLPIMVGGTGLYIDSVIYEYSFLPAPDPGLRSHLNSLNISELLKEAEARGLDTSAVDNRNKRRIIRLIENNGALPTRSELRGNTVILGLRLPAEERRTRIERRVEAMLMSGLEQEVSQLAARYGWDVEPMKGIGYKEFLEYFEGNISIDQVRERIVRNTVALAKRQSTWFKRNNSIHWLNDRSKIDEIIDIITTNLNNNF